ncbi:AzlD domain-containing protein [Acinetobacter gerneri]|uniref:AzlD domain-containing protein n=1 Tax=Acinetobacter gerneri TaxID=202952 RepID=A0AAW8JNM8_9GAMM|nr:AzlD domain-containing protein [Acinetobacter gerneri]MDQ9011180.1 AzlD domain-containing protein [Acinetobacter gerneri]MDQ9015310.1 AzlD domain-containing protein [Acinetobacter gerneri]MDQ9026481.1 AzlD domain-containing protein [Acinetobacter gerneri]MDQ9053762.1 AzlD domain-containing protein [Acinetobacter gerneri]MDQ9061438.1 AzlD domain-containing protein [Acinetobacter gerneri]
MINQQLILISILLLAGGTYMIRYSGFYLADRFSFSSNQKQMFSDAACVLLFSLAVLSTFFNESTFSGSSKIIGVMVALIFAWKKYSLIVVIIVAVILTALFRYIGLS